MFEVSGPPFHLAVARQAKVCRPHDSGPLNLPPLSSPVLCIPAGQSLDLSDSGLRFQTSQAVARMHPDLGQLKPSGCDGYSYPENHVVLLAEDRPLGSGRPGSLGGRRRAPRVSLPRRDRVPACRPGREPRGRAAREWQAARAGLRGAVNARLSPPGTSTCLGSFGPHRLPVHYCRISVRLPPRFSQPQ